MECKADKEYSVTSNGKKDALKEPQEVEFKEQDEGFKDFDGGPKELDNTNPIDCVPNLSTSSIFQESMRSLDGGVSDAEMDEMILKMVKEDSLRAGLDEVDVLEAAKNAFDFSDVDDWQKLVDSPGAVWMWAEQFDMEHRLLTEVEALIVELTEVDVTPFRRIDLLLLLWIRRPEHVRSTLVHSFLDILRNYLSTRLFALINAPGHICKSVGKHVILPVFRFLLTRHNEDQMSIVVLVKSVFSICNEAVKSSVSEGLTRESEILLYTVAEEGVLACSEKHDFQDDTTCTFITRLVAELFDGPMETVVGDAICASADAHIADELRAGRGIQNQHRRLSGAITEEVSHTLREDLAKECLRVQKLKLVYAFVKNQIANSQPLDAILRTLFGSAGEGLRQAEIVLLWISFHANPKIDPVCLQFVCFLHDAMDSEHAESLCEIAQKMGIDIPPAAL